MLDDDAKRVVAMLRDSFEDTLCQIGHALAKSDGRKIVTENDLIYALDATIEVFTESIQETKAAMNSRN